MRKALDKIHYSRKERTRILARKFVSYRASCKQRYKGIRLKPCCYHAARS